MKEEKNKVKYFEKGDEFLGTAKKKKKNFRKYYQKKNSVSDSKIGRWTIQEEKVMLDYLKKHVESFETDFIRRSVKVFRNIAVLVQTRCPTQCRSHFQKLKVYSKEQTTQSVIEHLQNKIKIIQNCTPKVLLPKRNIDKVMGDQVKKQEKMEQSDERLTQLVKMEPREERGYQFITFSIDPTLISAVW